MKNNFYNIPEDWYKEFNDTFNVTNFNVSNQMNPTPSHSLADPKVAFLRGNLFNELYDPYKNYKYADLKPSNQKEELLYNIMMYKFVLTDLNIYLDNYPNDTECIMLFNKYLAEEKKLSNQYEKNYGPLTVDNETMGTDYWKWIKSPWPWEGTK